MRRAARRAVPSRTGSRVLDAATGTGFAAIAAARIVGGAVYLGTVNGTGEPRGSLLDDQLRHYKAKLEYGIDPWDLNEALERGDNILLVDTPSPEAYRRGHIPGAIISRIERWARSRRPTSIKGP